MVTNVKVQQPPEEMYVACEYEGSRYHIWARKDASGLSPRPKSGPKLFRKSPGGEAEPLDPNSPDNASIVQAMLATARDKLAA